MRGLGLIVGFGLGAVIGAAVGAYLVASEEDKTKWKDNVNSTVDKAKQTVDKAKQKIDQVIDENFSGWNKSSV